MWNKTISTERIINRACGQNTFEYGLREGQRSERNVDEEKNIRLTKRASQPICSESHFTRVHIFKHLHTQRIFNVVCVCVCVLNVAQCYTFCNRLICSDFSLFECLVPYGLMHLSLAYFILNHEFSRYEWVKSVFRSHVQVVWRICCIFETICN